MKTVWSFVTQIRLWEKDSNRVQYVSSCYYDDFPSKVSCTILVFGYTSNSYSGYGVQQDIV
jgi:hypothetical protein